MAGLLLCRVSLPSSQKLKGCQLKGECTFCFSNHYNALILYKCLYIIKLTGDHLVSKGDRVFEVSPKTKSGFCPRRKNNPELQYSIWETVSDVLLNIFILKMNKEKLNLVINLWKISAHRLQIFWLFLTSETLCV